MVPVRRKEKQVFSLPRILAIIGVSILLVIVISLFETGSPLDSLPSHHQSVLLQDTVTTTTKNDSSHKIQQVRTPKATIAFAVTVTGCGSDPITEGGAVLMHSIHRASSRGHLGGKYDYALYAFYHPSAEKCALTLQELGYTLLKRDTFIKVSDIKGEFLRSKIESNGCCGEKELIKLEAYTLTQHAIVVHLDLDVIILKPMDELFDMMLEKNAPVTQALQWPNKPIPSTIDVFYTVDYNMVSPGTEFKPVQGGFLVMRPSMEVYNDFRNIVLGGDFRDGKGWGGKVGPFHGSMTFQGLIPYYYHVLHPNTSIELARCIYNQMCDNPRTERTVNDVVHGACRTGEEECEDCRSRPIEDVVTTHFTLCQKPWWCLTHSQDMIQHRLCRKLTHEWFKIRSELELSWGRSGRGPGEYDADHFYGYCSSSGDRGYLKIEAPYGEVVVGAR